MLAALLANSTRSSSMIRKCLALLVTIWLAVHHSYAQVYHTDWKQDKPIAAAIVGLGVADAILYSQLEGLTPSEVDALDQADILSIDRFVVRNRNLSQESFGDVLQFTTFGIPLLTLLDGSIREESASVLIMFAETLALNGALTGLTKFSVRRNRPLLYNPDIPLADKVTVSGRLSFFSGHTSNSAALCFFTAKVFSDFHPDSRVKPLVWAGAATLPLLVGLARVEAGKHFLTDVITGYAVGAAIGYLIPAVHRVQHDRVSLGIGEAGILSLRITLDSVQRDSPPDKYSYISFE